MSEFIKFIKIPLLSIFIFFNLGIINTRVFAVEDNQNKNLSISLIKVNNNFEAELLSPEYIVSAGDTLNIVFKGLDILNSKHSINPEGFINLPELNKYKAEGKTVSEIEKELELKYEEFIYNPDLEVTIFHYRPVSIYISGEVKEPGIYKLDDGGNINYTFPRLYSALKAAKGINNYASLSEIKIIRKNSNSQGGGKIEAMINLIELFNNGDQSQNVRLFDGDTIIIPKNDEIFTRQILKINRTNINPENITIFITGNANANGEIEVKKGSSLIQALSSTGGKKLFTGDVEFIRYNYDGSTNKSVFRYNSNARINSLTNPILMDGDIINVKRTLLGASAEIISDVTGPILSWYGLFNLFD